ncbi:MAG: hypothetical protein ABSB40_04450 [Nitrososphaeria archaeon]|jgi:hypothetical protein
MNRQEIFFKVFGDLNREIMAKRKEKENVTTKIYHKNYVLTATKRKGKTLCPECGIVGNVYQIINLNIRTNRIAQTTFIQHSNGLENYVHKTGYTSIILPKICSKDVPLKIWKKYKNVEKKETYQHETVSEPLLIGEKLF